MVMKNQTGIINTLLLPLILTILLFIGALSFAVWAFQGRQDYKNNVDQKIAVAVTASDANEDAKDNALYAQEAKNPLATYVGPAAFGSLHLSYPKTWSAYIDESSDDTGNTDINGYFYPSFVPDVTNTSNSYALRVEILNSSYSSVLQTIQNAITAGGTTVAPYSLPKIPNVVGSILEGNLVTDGSTTKSGTMVVLPLRNTTLEIWTEASQFESDFTNSILPNVSFSP
jgi:hypothetical protein